MTNGTGTVASVAITNIQVTCITTTVTYTIGGTASGLSGAGLVLQDNGGNDLPVSGNGSFAFTTPIASGATYSVTVLSQPSGPAQYCQVTGGSGTATANVTSVHVTCTTDTVTYTVGGIVINLASGGGGLQIQNNATESLLVNSNGTFTFPTALPSGSNYSVTVSIQPSSPAQTCGVTNGTGTATANVSSVVVDCGHKEWTWDSGSSGAAVSGTYGTEGTPAPGNAPGARSTAVTWTDGAGNLWLFGGSGYIDNRSGYLNDLWEYSAGEWTWMGGSNLLNQQGSYGTQGTAAASNIPGARYGAVSWIDKSGNFWLFGGYGYGSSGTFQYLNDLWEYSAGQWTWMGGSSVANQQGTYGTQGTADPGNIPGARNGAVTWIDKSGNFWLFGGNGYGGSGTFGHLNDLWEYSAGQWTWMGGSNVANQFGTYGTQGTAAAGNVPGSRERANAWTDAAGNFWLFGGHSYDKVNADLYFNDLWEYSAGQWTWVSGSNTGNQTGTYGIQGIAAAGNVPGARSGAVNWTDEAGNFWLFGGTRYDPAVQAELNDLWMYSAGQWTWMGGSNVANQLGIYGFQGTPAPSNIPGAREQAVGWTDKSGNFWLFGGYGFAAVGAGPLNDLWMYKP